jgi:hypothetical protein
MASPRATYMFILAVAVGTATDVRADPPLNDPSFKLVGELPPADIVDGCGWNASADGKAFFSAALDQSAVRMRIGGKTVNLQPDDSVEAEGSLDAVGNQWRQVFRQGDMEVHAEFTVTWVCPPNDESCEVTRYNVRFTVTDGSWTEVIDATGDVGC